MPTQSRYTARKLHGNACNKFASVPNISAASCEEEASPEVLSFKISAGDCAGDCGLSCACQAVEPEDAVLVFFISPVVYLSKKLDANIKKI